MENNLDSVRRMVKELHATQLVQDGVFGVVDHVVRDNGGKSVTFQGEQTAT